MEAKDIEKYKKELLQIGTMINDFGAEYARCSLDKKRVLPNLPQLTEDIFAISFKAGMEEETKGGHNSISYLEGYQEGEKKGIREVVEWINKFKSDTDSYIHISFGDIEWQAFKKSKGVE